MSMGFTQVGPGLTLDFPLHEMFTDGTSYQKGSEFYLLGKKEKS
jgi:hypothetical protein